jgi:hypothetical protein
VQLGCGHGGVSIAARADSGEKQSAVLLGIGEGVPHPSRMARVTILLAAIALGGCSSLGASAVRTGPVRLPSRSGPVAIYTPSSPPVGTDLGVVEVHGSQYEGTLEDLVPLFVAKVAEIGGDAAVIEDVRASFDVVSYTQTETYTYPCGYGGVCTGLRLNPASNEVMTVTMRGRAVALKVGLPR